MKSNKRNAFPSDYGRFNASTYLANIQRRLTRGFLLNNDREAVCSIPIDLSAPETWPVVMELTEVAQALRYSDRDTVRDLTNVPVDEGGLRYLSIGAGRKRRKRLVLKVDLLEFLSRISTSPTRPEAPKRASQKSLTKTSTGGLMARSTRRPPRN